ncbi:hypothetical protein K503DRAFT_785446 [Rhizopogon vinicolor AM-OR11-026]|uniref:DUF6534 domain-containing protein n=1 Tax=Rhizopogon vinicolor AM-OR11-026 TaxID=1314800 RepID=A0A1B7MQM9_9AGAM|nr:hypothetical protein K503DRAFT_785446 [Rhizopogon vinicolor AM-OR11-026]
MAPSTQRVDLGNTYGALFIGIILGAVLFGISNVQTFVYFHTRSKKGITFYALVVIFLWVLDALHLIVIVHCVYHYLVTDFSNISSLTEVVWSFKLHILFECMLCIYIAYGKVFIPLSMDSLRLTMNLASSGRSRIIPIAVVSAASTLASLRKVNPLLVHRRCLKFRFFHCLRLDFVHLFSDFAKVQWITVTGLASVTLVDMLIASSLCYFLATSRTGFSSIDSFMSKLMGFAINTGILTRYYSFHPNSSLIPCLDFVQSMPKNFVFLSIQFLFPKRMPKAFFETGYYSINATRSPIDDQKQYRRTSKLRTIESSWMDSVCTLPDDDVLYPARPAQTLIHPHRGITVEVQMESLSDV